jgi:hypothetical protein
MKNNLLKQSLSKYNLIFEGCDCVGKTKIAKHLCNKYGLKYNHLSAPKDLNDGKKQYKELINKLNNNVGNIYDRGWLGEFVYGLLIRGYSPNYLRDLEKNINDNNVLILITAPLETIYKWFDDVFITKDLIKPVQNEFLLQYEHCNINKKFKLFNDETMSMQKIEFYIEKEIEKYENRKQLN